MRTLRRFLVLVALTFWLGGFTFYAGVVVPVGTRALGSSMLQALITRQVTIWLNVAGSAALVPMLWDLLLTRDGAPWRRQTRLALWLFALTCQVGLVVLRARLAALFDFDALVVDNPDLFRLLHRSYLWLHTIQWLAAVAFVVLMLKGWQSEDESRAPRLSGAASDQFPAEKKSPAADRFGVAQSPSQPRGGTDAYSSGP